MRIHVVQKGETLWEIAQKYGVDFNEVVQLNSHLSNPDMIMPGMKIKIPSASKQVKKEKLLDKDMKKYPKKEEQKNQKQEKKEEIKQGFDKPAEKKPVKNTSPKPLPVIKEDDVKKPMSGKESFGLKPGEFPKIPMVGQFLESSKSAMNIPDFLKQGKEQDQWEKKKDKKDKDEKKGKKPDTPLKPAQQENPYCPPAMEQAAPNQYLPQTAMPMQPSMMPMSNYPPAPHGMPMNPVPYPVEYNQPDYTSLYPIGEGEHESPADFYPTQTHPQQALGLPHVNPGYGQNYMESSSSLEMPHMPPHLAGGYNHCGCGGGTPAGYGYYNNQPYGHQWMTAGPPYNNNNTGYPGDNYGNFNPYGAPALPQYPQQYGYPPAYNQGGYPAFNQPGYVQGYPAGYPFSGIDSAPAGTPGYGIENQPFYRPDDEESE